MLFFSHWIFKILPQLFQKYFCSGRKDLIFADDLDFRPYLVTFSVSKGTEAGVPVRESDNCGYFAQNDELVFPNILVSMMKLRFVIKIALTKTTLRYIIIYG